MKNGMKVNFDAKFSTTALNNDYTGFTLELSIRNNFLGGFLYITGTLYFFFWFNLIQGLMLLETIEQKEKGVKLGSRILYFLNYCIIHWWMNMIALFLTTSYDYLNFISTFSRIASTISMLVFCIAILFSFCRPYLDTHKVITWSIFCFLLFSYTISWIFFLYPVLTSLIMLNSSVYIILSFIWVVTIMSNFIFGVRVAPLMFICINVSFFVCVFGCKYFRPSEYFNAYDFYLVFVLFIPHLFLIGM